METYTKQELDVILQRHAEWLRGSSTGERANLHGANLSKANLSGANLSKANLSRVDLRLADLYGATLYGATLYGATLYGANLSKANLSRVDLRLADLSDVKGVDIITFSRGKHQAIYVNGELTIGCHVHSLGHWLAHGEEIGETEGYSEEEIKHYMNFIRSL